MTPIKISFKLAKTHFRTPSLRWVKSGSKLCKQTDLVWRSWLRWLTTRTDIQIQKKSDRAGHLYWQVYDPLTHKHLNFSSEAEVRIWLEQRYHQ